VILRGRPRPQPSGHWGTKPNEDREKGKETKKNGTCEKEDPNEAHLEQKERRPIEEKMLCGQSFPHIVGNILGKGGGISSELKEKRIKVEKKKGGVKESRAHSLGHWGGKSDPD